MSTITRLTPPQARPQHTETTLHGHTLTDDYAWLRDKDSPETLAYLHAENDYTNAVLEPTAELQKTLYREMLSHIKETDISVPFRDGDYWYYTRTEEGLQYPIYCRKHGSLDAPETVTLDVNQLAEGESFMSLGAFTVSDDGNLLAYSIDNKGFRQYTLQVKDLRTANCFPNEWNVPAQSSGLPTTRRSSTALKMRSKSVSINSFGTH
jgi:oligopeptidase B